MLGDACIANHDEILHDCVVAGKHGGHHGTVCHVAGRSCGSRCAKITIVRVHGHQQSF